MTKQEQRIESFGLSQRSGSEQSWKSMIHGTGEQMPNEPKLRCGGPGAPVESTAARGEGAAPAGLGGGAGAVTEPGGLGAADRKLTALPAVTCSALLGRVCHDCGKQNLASRYVFNGLTRCDECGDAIIRGVESLFGRQFEPVVLGGKSGESVQNVGRGPSLLGQVENPGQDGSMCGAPGE